MFTSSKHNPRGTTPHFDNERVRHRSGDPEALAGIVALSRERTLALIRFHGSHRYLPECELVSNVTWKLVRSVHRFDPARGSSAFTFMSCLIENELRSSVTRARRMAERHVALDEAISIQLVTRSDSQARDAIDDLAHKIRSEVKTILSDPAELEAARWLVASFIDAAFELARWKCAGAAQVVYGISHDRSRQLYDLCLLACRRLMFAHLPPRPPIVTAKLAGRREGWMLRFAPLMDAAEFSKFFTLLHNLSPYVILLVDPSNKSPRQDRCAAVSRRNIEFVLGGHPDALPLFT